MQRRTAVKSVAVGRLSNGAIAVPCRQRASIVKAFMAVALAVACLAAWASAGIAHEPVRSKGGYTKTFRMEKCSFTSFGETAYWVLRPGYQLIYEGVEDGAPVRRVSTVLKRTEKIELPGMPILDARIVNETSWEDGAIAEITLSYYAICKDSGDLYEFAAESTLYNADGAVRGQRSWRAGELSDDKVATAGLRMPGTFLVGARYFHHVADGRSMRRGENMAAGLQVTTPAGSFEQCVKILESNPLDDEVSERIYAPGVGMVRDGPFELVAYGFKLEHVASAPMTAEAASRRISDERAREIALAAVPGEVMDVAVERKLGDKRLVVEVIAKADLAETDVIIDMVTGEILAIEK